MYNFLPISQLKSLKKIAQFDKLKIVFISCELVIYEMMDLSGSVSGLCRIFLLKARLLDAFNLLQIMLFRPVNCPPFVHFDPFFKRALHNILSRSGIRTIVHLSNQDP